MSEMWFESIVTYNMVLLILLLLIIIAVYRLDISVDSKNRVIWYTPLFNKKIRNYIKL